MSKILWFISIVGIIHREIIIKIMDLSINIIIIKQRGIILIRIKDIKNLSTISKHGFIYSNL